MRVIAVVVARLVRRGLFRQVEVVGLERIPRDRPVLLVANHFNGFVDVAVLVASLGRLPRFVAKSTIAVNPVVRLVLRWAGVVLVRRPEDDPAGTVDNAELFRDTTAALARGDMVALFPEGTTHDRPSVARIRTGAARIALGAHAAGTPVLVVPVGITYYDKVALRSSVLVQIGEPLAIGGVADGSDDVRACTALIEQRLRDVTPDFDDPAEWDAADLAASVHLRTASQPEPSLWDRAQVVAELGDLAPDARRHLTDALGRYHLALASAHLDDEQVLTGAPLRRLVRPFVVALVALTVLAPVTLFGLAVNVVPALIVAATGLFVGVPVTKGTVRVLTGLVVFPVAWIVAAVVLADAAIAQAAIVVGAPIAGFIALAGAGAVASTIERALDWRVATERRAAVPDLRARRADVVATVEEALTTARRQATDGTAPSADSASGRLNENVAPCSGSLSTHTVPPSSST